jgi:hypothetical protein
VLDKAGRHCLEADRLSVRERAYKGLAQDEKPELSAPLITSVFERQKVRIACGGD